MNLPTTKFLATVPNTNCAASTPIRGNAAFPASASGRLLPGDAADFAQSIHPGQSTKADTAEPQSTAFPPISTEPESGTPMGDMAKAEKTDNTDRAGSTATTGKPDSRGDAILNALGGALEGTLGGVATQTADTSASMGSADPAGPTNSSGLTKISGMKQRVLTQLVGSILVSAQKGKQEVPTPVQDAALKDTTGACMSQSTTESPAALPSTNSTASTASVANQGNTGNTAPSSTVNTADAGSTAAPASASGRPLPGDAADFAPSILPGQPAKADTAGPQGSTLPPISTEPESGKLVGDMTRADKTDRPDSTATTGKPDSQGDALPTATPPASASGRPLPGAAADFAPSILPGQPAKADTAEPQGPALPPISTEPESGKLAGDMMKTDKSDRPDRPDRADSTATTGKPDSRGDAILSALGGVATHPADASPSMGSVDPVGQTSASGLAEISGMNQRLLTQLVDSILVSAQEGKQEVRIKVQDAVLKDTTIVVRMQDGNLEVQLHTSNNYSSQLLHQNVDALRHALEGHQFGETVRVKVEDRAAGQHTDGQGTGRDADRGQGGQGEQQNQRSHGNFLWDKDEG